MIIDLCSRQLSLPVTYLKDLSRQASYLYRTYTIPKKSGGIREIHHPAPELKTVQRWLVDSIIASLPVHDAAFAYRKGLGIRRHAEAHTRASYLLRLDIRDFFPSITSVDICKLMEDCVGTDGQDLKWIVDIACRNGKLTIGAPSSPSISNAVCFEMDQLLSGISEETGVTYTRYADDMYFSTSRPNVLSNIENRVSYTLRKLNTPEGLYLNRDKSSHSSKKGRMMVTGLVLTPEGSISLGRDRKRAIRSCVYRFDSLSGPKRKSLSGALAFAKDIEPGFINKLYVYFGHEIMDVAMRGKGAQ